MIRYLTEVIEFDPGAGNEFNGQDYPHLGLFINPRTNCTYAVYDDVCNTVMPLVMMIPTSRLPEFTLKAPKVEVLPTPQPANDL